MRTSSSAWVEKGNRMWDSFKYLPLDWRKRDNDCTPLGPRMSFARSVSFIIGGSRLTFLAPKHSPHRRQNSSTEPNKYKHEELSGGLQRYAKDLMANDFWRSRTIFRREWAFWGPWMTGAKAQLAMAVTIVGRDENHEYANASFFHPRVFESVVADFLNARYGHSNVDDALPYRGPLNWKPLRKLSVFGARCTICKVGSTNNLIAPLDLLLFPITDKHFIKITFDPRIYSKDRSGPFFDTSPIDDLQKAIINTIKLELGPEAQAEWNRVSADCPDMSLTEHFAPLKWPIDPDSQESAVEDAPDRLTKLA